MIYLKFIGKDDDSRPLETMTISCKKYSTARDDVGVRVYYEDGAWERVSPNDWLNCFVMSDSGKTIDKLEA